MTWTRADFPEGFLFGAATAAYQIEGHGAGGAGPSHWDSFAATPGRVARGENGAIACDHYHRYPEDLALAAALNLDAYRFSTSWARVMPDGRNANPEGLDFYDRLTDAVCAAGMKPFHTLYHWDLPSALADLGGWANRDVAQWFADYAEAITRRIGDRTASTATINEPWCVAWLSHFLGIHAPGLRDIRAAARAMHHVLLAHGTAMTRLRGLGQPNLGIVLNFEHAAPATDAPADIAAAATEDAIYNRWFIEALTKGTYPAEALAGLAPHMPDHWQDDMAQISQPIDWLGVNYYTRKLHAADPGNLWPATRTVDGTLPRTQLGWEVYPEGLQSFLKRLSRDHVGTLPIHVTENGIALDDTVENGSVYDPRRTEFLDAHMEAVARAMAGGANVQGFFYWSLLDNFEWAEGYAPRFGLIHVDFATLRRTPKASYTALQHALAR